MAIICSLPALAETGKGVTTSTDLNLVAATTLQIKLRLIETVSLPFLTGASPLLENNSLVFKMGAEVSPVSINGTVDTVWTPIAFFQIVGGGSIGSAWNIPMGSGLRINERSGAHDSDLHGNAFDGIVWSAKAGGVFKFDYAAIKPGLWHHIVFRTMQVAQYRELTSADKDDSWLYESDDGENRNGWNYYGNYFLGYQMPLIVDMVGVLVETEKFLYDTPGGDIWGDDLMRWTFGPIANIGVNKKTSVALLVQWRTRRNYTDATENYDFYQDRVVTDSDPLHIEFYRAAVNVNFKLK